MKPRSYSAVARLGELGAERSAIVAQLDGVEIHPTSARAAVERLKEVGYSATVEAANFFDVTPRPAFDAVIGNPPYVRYQNFSGEDRAKGLQAALAQGVRLTGLASSWAAITIDAAQFLKAGGRLGLVLPGELLSVNYAAQVRRFLLRRFASVRLVLFEELVFPGVLEEVALLLAEGENNGGGLLKYEPKEADLLPVPSLATLEAVSGQLRNLAPQIAGALRSTDSIAAIHLVDRVLLEEHLRLSGENIAALR